LGKQIEIILERVLDPDQELMMLIIIAKKTQTKQKWAQAYEKIFQEDKLLGLEHMI
jgi:hypothetical protein